MKNGDRKSRRAIVVECIAQGKTEEQIVNEVVVVYPDVEKKRIEAYVHFLVKHGVAPVSKVISVVSDKKTNPAVNKAVKSNK